MARFVPVPIFVDSDALYNFGVRIGFVDWLGNGGASSFLAIALPVFGIGITLFVTFFVFRKFFA